MTHLNRLWTYKCIFEVHGPKQNRSTSLRTPSAFYSNSYFSEPLSAGYGYFRFAIVVFVYEYDGFVILYDVMIISI